MKKLFIPLVLLSVTAFAQNRMTPDLLWSLKRVSGDGVSASGKTVYYTSRSYNVETEKSTAKKYAVNLVSGNTRELTGKSVFQKEADAWYAMDEKAIYRSTDLGKNWQVFYNDVAGMENVRISPDGNFIAFSKEVLIKPMMGTDIYKDLPKTTAQIYTDLNFRHWDTWEDGKFSHVFVTAAKIKNPIDIMANEPYDCPQKPFGGTEDFIWSPDSKSIIYVSKKKFGKEYAQSTNTDIYQYDLHTGNTVNLTVGMMGYDMSPAFSVDGNYLAWTSMAHDGFEADKNDIYVMNIKDLNRSKMNLTANWDGTVSSFAWNEEGSRELYFNAAWRGTEQLFMVYNPGLTKMMPVVRQVTDGKFDINALVGVTPQQVIVSRTDMNHAAEIFAVDKKSGSMTQLSHENDAAYSRIAPSNTELKMVRTTDGKQMGVWVIYPPDFNPNKKYPTLLYCQGGPQSSLSQFYSFRWNFQLMAAKGYIVVAPNRRGMPGWGVKWNADISKDWGGQPMQDYLSAIDAISRENYVDKDRLGCVGASYGGYSVFMLAGMHNKRFKSFIAHDGLFDMKSWYGTTEELWFANWDLGGPYWKKPAPKGYEKFNPSNFVDKWNTPILIIQGGIDYRVPIEQGLEAFQAAQLRGIKSKLLYLPNENHWVLHAQNAMVWQREFFKWLDETLK
ncbi:MAG TPA: S9 family peptidase [Flavipsychrobacter sp.]|nr:S9 family peptidase [Flavipsychrobacter sp.]